MISIRSSAEEAISFVGALFSDPAVFAEVFPALSQKFGEVFFESPCFQWNHTDYYDRELNPPILRKFIFFRQRIDPAVFSRVKVETVALENRFLAEGRRQINLDPGYLTLAKVVLASRKNYSHRICIGRGVFAELELYFRDGDFHPMPYTYTDYREERSRKVFREAREIFKKAMSGSLPEREKVL